MIVGIFSKLQVLSMTLLGRKLMLSSTLGVAAALLALAAAFRLLEGSAPAVDAAASTCPAGAPPPGGCPACLTAGCADVIHGNP